MGARWVWGVAAGLALAVTVNAGAGTVRRQHA